MLANWENKNIWITVILNQESNLKFPWQLLWTKKLFIIFEATLDILDLWQCLELETKKNQQKSINPSIEHNWIIEYVRA